MGDGGSNQRNAVSQHMDGFGDATPLLLIQGQRIHHRRIFQKIHIDASKPSDVPQSYGGFHCEGEVSLAGKKTLLR